MSARVKETAIEEVERVRELAAQAVSSGTYVYPLKGFFYFASHRALWKPLTAKLAPIITTGIGVTTFMFVFTYLPQAAILAIFNGPLAALSTILLVLSESSTISNLLSRTFFIEDALIDTFDGTLVSRGMTSIVSEGRQIKPGSDPINKLGKLLKKPFARFTPKAIIRYLIYLPLNFIPVVGTIMFVILQGRKAGPAAHARYFQLKGMNSRQKESFVDERKAAYTSFGVPAVLLELVPIAGLFFSFTNTVGAALWAADMEQSNTTAPNLREQAKKAE
ncbi:hypothetical protein GTA08_BOTSDO02182 [Neofusicoccum parvum]|uniref:Outer spore wall protein RRT8 n=2 Tax=Neofusicoccum parvum TaxID=310453 RepID=R1EUW8_BOTPV|nr:putative protein family protein [Neofusicoccum parvum UCRNP2]GME27486.1 hypothetical protein GTA08_BOTSDO02182 [Neofusicoccum parvum]GME39842.1 hypothetical protein GTA08_BOTSDO02182 [Neofusicoccum parvum]